MKKIPSENMTGDQLKEIREGMRMRQADLAAVLDVERKTVGRWERGETPIHKTVAYYIKRRVVPWYQK